MVSLKNGFLFAAHLVAAQKGTNSTVVVKTDVVVVGGGGSGAHAAVRLTDYGQDVILIEKQSNLVRRASPSLAFVLGFEAYR